MVLILFALISNTFICCFFFLLSFFFLRFDGDVITTDEKIRTLAQKWQPSKRLRLEEQSSKAVDTDMIILPCLVCMSPLKGTVYK